MRAPLVIAAALGLSACASLETPPDAGEDAGEIFYNPVQREALDGGGQVTSMLAGRWSNADQFAFAPEDLKRPPAPGHPYDWLDLQNAAFFTVEAPAIGEHVTYLEWRGADGEISRQRIWAFHEDAAGALSGMDFYTFADPAPYAGRGTEPGAFETLSAEALIGYPDGCTAAVRRPAESAYVLEIDPDQCAIIARSGRRMGIMAQIELAPDRLSYREAGVLEDGSYAFLVPGGPAYEFTRVED